MQDIIKLYPINPEDIFYLFPRFLYLPDKSKLHGERETNKNGMPLGVSGGTLLLRQPKSPLRQFLQGATGSWL